MAPTPSRVKAQPLQGEWQHGAGQRTERDNGRKRQADRQSDERPMLAVVVKAQLLPQYDARHADKTEDRTQGESAWAWAASRTLVSGSHTTG
jgi:hypothetical protein